MFGVRIALFACTLLGVTALLPLGAAEARPDDSYRGSYSKYSRTVHAKTYSHRGSYSKYSRAADPKSLNRRAHSTSSHSASRKSYAHNTSRKSYGRVSVKGYAQAGGRSRNAASAQLRVDNPRYAKAVGARPSAWCGWWMRTQKGGGPELNLARNWARWGRASGPQIGAVVVWSHHVGMITGRTANVQWIVKSGNDGGRVRERPRSVAGAVFRVA
jgi:hypothetical protein